jgi:hypothetical protein
MAKEKVTFNMKYKRPYPRFKRDVFPKLNHVEVPYEIYDVACLAVGNMDVDGEPYEYQDLRIILREKKS